MHIKRVFVSIMFLSTCLFFTMTIAATQPPPCDPEAHKQFDFWLVTGERAATDFADLARMFLGVSM